MPAERNSSSAVSRCLGRAREAIKSPDQNSVEFLLPCVIHEPVQLGAGILCPGLANISVFSGRVEAPRSAIGSQVSQLHLAALIFSADAGVDSNSHPVSG